MGVHRDGGFAEYVKASEVNIHIFHSNFDESLLALVEPYTGLLQLKKRGL